MPINVNFENQKFFYDLIMENKIENIDEDNNTVQINGELRRSNIQNKNLSDLRYCVIQYKNARIQFHRLVYMYHTKEFIPENLYINHIDGNKCNNHFSNLELVTQSENIQHAYRTGLNNNIAENHLYTNLTNDKVAQFRREFKAKERLLKILLTKPDYLLHPHMICF